MKILFRLLIMFLFFMTFADSSSFSEFAWRKEANDVFSDHEKLKFAVGWSFITVGSATMEVSDIEEYGGRKCYHIVSKARSAKFFDTFFKVRDVNESWIDAESLCSLKFVNNISEGKYKKVETLLFDHENQKYLIVESSKTGEIPLWVQDVLSSLYYLRTKELYVGAEFNIDAHSGDKSWPLKVKVLRKDKVKVPAGKFECFVVEPHVREDSGIFQAKGKIWVWLTADEKKIPVLMKSKVFIGSIVAKLVEFKI